MKYPAAARAIVLFATLAFALPSVAQQTPPRPFNECESEAIYGFPTSLKKDTTRICRKGYALEYDNKAKIPVWASYTLTPTRATGCYARTNAFAVDKSLSPDARSIMKDYAKSGYDQGHQVPEGDMRWDFQAEQESFLMSNMAPQLPEFNRGIWKKLEDSTRGWAVNRQHKLQIYMGPVYNRDQNMRIGRGQVTVPHGYWKVIIDTETSEVMVFIFPHEGSKNDLSTFISSFAELQGKTGLVVPIPKDAKYTKETWPRIMKSVSKTKGIVCSLKQ